MVAMVESQKSPACELLRSNVTLKGPHLLPERGYAVLRLLRDHLLGGGVGGSLEYPGMAPYLPS